MNIGGTKMEAPRPFLQESPTQPAGSSTPVSSSACSNLPLKNAQQVALETTLNPLSYWPPPASTVPSINHSKEAADGPRNQAFHVDPSRPTEPPKNSTPERDSSSQSCEETPEVNKSEMSHSFGMIECGLSSTNQPRILHHNLPPIAGITSSHNYRGVREIYKHSQVNYVEEGKLEKTATAELPTENINDPDLQEKESNLKTHYEKEKSKEAGDCEIVEVPTTLSMERHKTANSDYVFSIPAAINSTSQSKPLVSLRAPTPFVSSPTASTESLTLNVNSCSNLSAEPHSPSCRMVPSPLTRTAPSPSGRTAPSPSSRTAPSPSSRTAPSPSGRTAFSPSGRTAPSSSGRTAPSPSGRTAPSPSGRTVPSPSVRAVPSPHFIAPSPTIQSPLPSESPRILPSNLPSPSNLHRALSSSHMKLSSPVDGSRVLGSPHSVGHPQNNSSSPPHRSGSLPYVPNCHSNLAYLNTPRTNFTNSSAQNYHSDPNRPLSAQNPMEPTRQTNQLRNSLPQASLSSINPDPPQRINQSSDNQICRNPFELPMTKPYAYQQEQQNSMAYHLNNVRPVEQHQKYDQFMNLTREQHRVSSFYPPQFKSLSTKDSERLSDMKYKQMNSQPVTFSKGMYPMDQNDSSVQRRTMNTLRNEPLHHDFPKQPELIGSKQETSDFAYLNSRNVNKNFSKVNGNEYSNRKVPDVGYHNAVKDPPEVFAGRFNDRQNGSFNQMNSLSQRFPPVPQSNYDLNRHIYDSMTGGGRPAQPQMSRPPEKNPLHFVSSNMPINNPQSCKSQSYYREIQEPDKSKNYIQPVTAKGNEFSGQGRTSSGAYGQFNNLLEKSAQNVYQNKRPIGDQPAVNPPFSQAQSNDTRHSLPGPVPEHHKPLNQGFTPRINTSHHISQLPCPTLSSDGSKPVQSQPMFPQKHPQGLTEYDAKKLMDAKSNGNPQFSNSQPMIPPVQPKNRIPSSTTLPLRSKRESPLDLSVKTVRQSADSTAKDDGDIYLQNFRNFIHGPGQPPRSEARYSISHSKEGATGAPKIDFTPNFSGFHTDSPAMPSHHKPEISTLPPVESFKKFPTRLPTPAVQDPKNRSTFNPPKYFSSPNSTNQKPLSATVETSLRYPEHFRGEAQKRPTDDSMRTHSSQAKIPKIDPWKLAFDQQIEQRLNSARVSHQNNHNVEKAMNGVDSSKPSPVGSQYPDSYQRYSGNHYRGANMYPQPPVQTSATPYNPSYVQQPQCQPATPQTPQEKLQHRENVGHSPDPEQIIKQISKGVMPDHKLLQDKNVLSILRSSLEEKEAKLMQLREVAKRKEKFKDLMSSDPAKKMFQTFVQTSKNQGQGKQSLPPFGALSLERMCAPPSFPGHRLKLPRSVDTVKIDIEPTQKYFSPAVKNEGEKSGIPSADLSPHDDAQGPPTDLDGLAAFLAARIRTKGELKQVGPVLEPGKPGLSQHLKNHSELFDRGVAPTQSSTAVFQTNGSPPKLVRESRLLPQLRRRYFSHTEEETPTTSGTQSEDQQPLPPRDPNGIRSSSETSVFDFRESDSEGEMPVLERQTLEEMRRDRKTFGSKQNVSTTTPDDAVETEKPEVIAELDKSHPDPFWDTAFDMFVEQLEKRPPKRSVRKKKVVSRVPYAGSETEESDKPKISENVNDEVKEELNLDKVKKEPEEELDRMDIVPDGHMKLSSSRLKVYRNEMRLKEEKTEKEKEGKTGDRELKKETEKSKIVLSKRGETSKKDENGMKTRGKSKVEASILNYESESDERDVRSDSESTAEDDDDSLSLSGLESESTDSEASQESSNSNFSSSEDSENETVAKKKQRMQTRLQTRSSRQRQVKSTGMKLRSKPIPLPKAAAKPTRKKRKKKEESYSCGKKKKPSFGDGSDFRPGWEEECYKFKQQLRMPEKLISISRPPKRSSASLPDLDPYRNSPSLDSSDVSMTKKSEIGKPEHESDDSDVDSSKQKSGTQEGAFLESDNNISSLLKFRNGKKAQSSSIINMLVNKYGKGNLKKQKELKIINERKSPRILPKATNKPELLPTPGLGLGKENVLKDKKRIKDTGKKKSEENDSVYLGYFRRKTVNNFKEAFKQKVGLLPQEFSPVVLKSRTRTQTRDLKKRATLMEVFGDERPASAPPLIREEDTSTDQEKVEKNSEKKKPKVVKKVCGGVVTRGRGKLTRSGRPGLRSTAVLRSNKAVQNSKRHLNAGRKRNIDLLRIRAMASKKFSYLVSSSDATGQLPITKKRLKLKSVRRKFRSGFDYIRKKKKMKKDVDSADGSVKEKRLTVRPTSESVEDIQNEIKNWVINKGLGETILHRAARLGYTDVAAYCLEKMDCSPSPRDNAGYTPLHEACSRGHLEIAKLLLMYGASVSESAKGGVRPLHEAAENGFTELIRLLLSYGADPLLETYTGHTALSLVTDEEARRLIQHHLADVQGNVAPVWTFQGPASLFDPPESGYDPLCDPPSSPSVHSDFEFETSDAMLPTLYRLTVDRESERFWVLLKDVLTYTKAKSKEAILKQLGFSDVREMKLSDFNEQSKSCSLLGMGDKPPTKASKVILLPYDDKLRQFLGVDKFIV